MESAFTAPGHWYRGNLHAHSTGSDGKKRPDEVAAWYRAQGYDFIVMTDHRRATDVSGLTTSSFLVLPGIELDCVDPHWRSMSYHVVGVGITPFDQPEESRRGPAQALVDAIRRAGGEALLCHPSWSGQEASDLEFITGAFGVEVLNAGCSGNAKGDSTVQWDVLLDRGVHIWGVATDDAHHYTDDAGAGWIMVKASSLTREALLQALRAGHLYASEGPVLGDVRIEAGQVHVHTSPVQEIRFVANRGSGRVVRAAADQLLTSAVLPVPKNCGYVRVEVVDAQGKRAWSQPFFLSPGGSQ